MIVLERGETILGRKELKRRQSQANRTGEAVHVLAVKRGVECRTGRGNELPRVVAVEKVVSLGIVFPEELGGGG